jgi:exopolysaccharide biosynthesis protein
MRAALAVIALALLAACAAAPAPLPPDPVDDVLPFALSRLEEPGPLTGVVARVDLTDPRVSLRVALTDDRDPDGSGPCTGQLDTVTGAAKKHDFVLTLNASFFSAPQVNLPAGRKARYVVGNCGTPAGFHASGGKVIAQPKDAGLRAVFVVDENGRPDILDNVQTLPANIREAVSGNVIVLKAGEVVQHKNDTARHPRSVVALSRDRKTLFLVAIDGRQVASRGATYAELGELLKRLGAEDALNLDGGGSTALVLKDPYTGGHAVMNRPSDIFPAHPWLGTERPVADVIGVSMKWHRP